MYMHCIAGNFISKYFHSASKCSIAGRFHLVNQDFYFSREMPFYGGIPIYAACSMHVVTKLVVVITFPVVDSSPSQMLMRTAALASSIADGVNS